MCLCGTAAADLELMAVDEKTAAGAELDTSRRWKKGNDSLYILRAKTFGVVKEMGRIKNFYA